MLSIIKSMAITGIKGDVILVQVDVSAGLPYFEIIGLPDTTVRESKERVRVAIKNSGYDFYSKRVIVNLAPANTKKIGSIFDLPIAVGILVSIGIIKKLNFNDYVIIGELSLDGKIRKIKEALAICIEMKKQGIKNIILSKENQEELKIIDGINIYPVTELKEVVDFFNGDVCIEKMKNKNICDLKENENQIDFSDIYSQERAKRALEIAAAGGHNCLLIGPQGTGKTMLAQRIQTILPELSIDEFLEVAKINSLYSENYNFTLKRPFRAPHYTISEKGLIGGGDIPKPGEITLANYGVLFLDEFSEFKSSILELLRTPMEDKQICISRVKTKIIYPSNFILIAAMNPCRCGYYGSDVKKCICTVQSRKKYLEKISGPLLDRFDLFVEVPYIEIYELNKKDAETSKVIKERVMAARKIQISKSKKYNVRINAELNNKQIEDVCKLSLEAKKMLEECYSKLQISARAYQKIIKVARTIADLEAQENIEVKHIAEAIQYRRREE